MTPDLKPRPAMDRAVAEAVGWEVLDTSVPECPLIRVDKFDCKPMHPSSDVKDAIAALEATGEEFSIKSIVGDPGKRAYIVAILRTPPALCVKSQKLTTLPHAACLAILAWSKAKEEA